jgi:SpoIID/LytB domain protein
LQENRLTMRVVTGPIAAPLAAVLVLLLATLLLGAGDGTPATATAGDGAQISAADEPTGRSAAAHATAAQAPAEHAPTEHAPAAGGPNPGAATAAPAGDGAPADVPAGDGAPADVPASDGAAEGGAPPEGTAPVDGPGEPPAVDGPVDAEAAIPIGARWERRDRTTRGVRDQMMAEAVAAPLPPGPPITIRGHGWGHSVGMSQYGAQAQALAGRDHATILGHYYPGTELTHSEDADRDIRVNLFLNIPRVDTSRLQLQTAGGTGRPLFVNLGGGIAHLVSESEVLTLRRDVAGEAFVLSEASGRERGRGPGPVHVEYGVDDLSPFLRLPQLASGDRLAGIYRWGVLQVTADDSGNLRPVIELPIEAYLRGLAEMPSGWHVEALAAQAITGRGYAVRRVLEGVDPECDCHLGTTPHHQAYAGWAKEGGVRGDAWRQAVDMTTGAVLTYDDELAWTYYSSSHGGRSEASGDSWAYPETLPYLQSVDDPWSFDPAVRNPMATWERTVSNADFARAVGLAVVHAVEITGRTEGGSPSTLHVRGLRRNGTETEFVFRGWRKGVAGSDLKLVLRSTLPSQQIESITVGTP